MGVEWVGVEWVGVEWVGVEWVVVEWVGVNKNVYKSIESSRLSVSIWMYDRVLGVVEHGRVVVVVHGRCMEGGSKDA